MTSTKAAPTMGNDTPVSTNTAPNMPSTNAPSHTRAFDFMGLPPELRLNVYEYVFYDPLNQIPAAEILMSKVPYSDNLRRVSKGIRDESRKIYKQAEKVYDEKRKEVIKGMVNYWEKKAEEGLTWNEDTTPALAVSLAKPNERCQHACKKYNCYMCDDEDHQKCFECGRNLAVAVHFNTNEYDAREKKVRPLDRPQIVFPPLPCNPTEVTYGPTGRYIKSFGADHARAYDANAPNCFRTPPALRWWRTTLQTQVALETRILIRKKAVHEYHNNPGQTFGKNFGCPFDEFHIQSIEMRDKRWHRLEHTINSLCKGRLDWMRHFEMRAHDEAREKGIDVSELIPARQNGRRFESALRL